MIGRRSFPFGIAYLYVQNVKFPACSFIQCIKFCTSRDRIPSPFAANRSPLEKCAARKKPCFGRMARKRTDTRSAPVFTKFGNYSYDVFKSFEVVHPIMVLWKMRCLTLGIAKIIMFPHFLGDCSRNSSLTYIAFGNQAKTPVRVSHDWRQALFIDSNFEPSMNQ